MFLLAPNVLEIFLVGIKEHNTWLAFKLLGQIGLYRLETKMVDLPESSC